jgi:phosphatidylglycerol:prolipoprotein diacylglycerol transferase
MIVIVALAIVLLLPRIEEPIPAGFLTLPPLPSTEGLPIRGYGSMLLLAVLAGVGLALWRAMRAGMDPDLMTGLAFVMVLGGLVGARLLFVVQYWGEIRAETPWLTMVNIVSTVQGGLVVYGSLLGGVLAFLVYTWRYRLPILPLADLIAPCLALGMAIGRLGCLLNGCCYGDVCPHDYTWGITFPPDSPPYVRQQSLGLLHGLRIEDDEDPGGVRIAWIDPHGPLAGQQVQVGDRIVAINGRRVDGLQDAQHQLLSALAGRRVSLQLSSGVQLHSIQSVSPPRSLPVHPTQLYSALNAALLFLLGIAFFPFRRRHGQTIALVVTLYAVTRFLLEMIRTDEGAFWVGLTISQNLSLAIGLGMLVLWLFVQRQPLLPDARS